MRASGFKYPVIRTAIARILWVRRSMPVPYSELRQILLDRFSFEAAPMVFAVIVAELIDVGVLTTKNENDDSEDPLIVPGPDFQIFLEGDHVLTLVKQDLSFWRR